VVVTAATDAAALDDTLAEEAAAELDVVIWVDASEIAKLDAEELFAAAADAADAATAAALDAAFAYDVDWFA
jgi:ABC-type thiamine transport system substrate-binding protein